tara:strand:- start:2028 stop:2156 length:129 start_codon:yes stop_codon:yes gene_type:complete
MIASILFLWILTHNMLKSNIPDRVVLPTPPYKQQGFKEGFSS